MVLGNLKNLQVNLYNLFIFSIKNILLIIIISKFQVLDLSNTGISEFPENMFSRLSNVQTLFLNGNHFQNIPKEIRDMPLAYLNLNANPIRNLDSESFVGLDKLQQLILSGMPNLTDIGSGTFAPLKKLITLRMAYNPSLSNIHYDAFRDHTTNQLSLRQVRSVNQSNSNNFTILVFDFSYI